MTHTIVSLHRWADAADVVTPLGQCLSDLGGIAALVKPGQTVVIKPNLTANAPEESGGTTRVALVEALVRAVQNCSPARVIVAEGTGQFGLAQETAFPRPAWREMAARTGCELYNLDAGPHTHVHLEERRYPEDLPISTLILDADVLITVPCLKPHLTTDYTVALKNGFAHIPQVARTEAHRRAMVEHALVDINRARRPDVIVVDGYDGCEGIAGGNKFDRPAGARLLMAGTDPVAVDLIARQLMGLSERTRYLNWAIADGVGTADLSAVEIRGESVATLTRRFETPAEEVCGLLSGLQFIDQGACSGCRAAALSAAQRYLYQGIAHPFAMVVGAGETIAALDRPAIAVGCCAAKHSHLGTYIPGCPAPLDAIREALEQQDLVCQRCRWLAERLHDRIPAVLAPYLRLVASGMQVHLGDQVSGPWHVELLVGQCSAAYAERVIERATQYGLDPERDVVHLPGHPVTEDELLAALEQLANVVEAHQQAQVQLDRQRECM